MSTTDTVQLAELRQAGDANLQRNAGVQPPRHRSVTTTLEPKKPKEGKWKFWPKWDMIKVFSMLALIFAIIFGAGAWAGQNYATRVAVTSNDMAIYGLCADHEELRTTEKCKEIMAQTPHKLGIEKRHFDRWATYTTGLSRLSYKLSLFDILVTTAIILRSLIALPLCLQCPYYIQRLHRLHPRISNPTVLKQAIFAVKEWLLFNVIFTNTYFPGENQVGLALKCVCWFWFALACISSQGFLGVLDRGTIAIVFIDLVYPRKLLFGFSRYSAFYFLIRTDRVHWYGTDEYSGFLDS